MCLIEHHSSDQVACSVLYAHHALVPILSRRTMLEEGTLFAKITYVLSIIIYIIAQYKNIDYRIYLYSQNCFVHIHILIRLQAPIQDTNFPQISTGAATSSLMKSL